MPKSTFSKARIYLLVIFFTTYFNYSFCRSNEPVKASRGMVVSASKLASEVGIDILKRGGNAVDAAVAVGFALAVTYPAAGNIGGGGFMVIHLKNGKNTSIDFREKAPLKAYRNMFLDKYGNFDPQLSQQGVTSAGVPGSVAGLLYALHKYGTMKLGDVLQPAINMAKNGFILDRYLAESFEEHLKYFREYPSSFKKFTNDGKPFKKGDLFKQPELAETLELIKENGSDGFYKGRVADLFIKKIQSLGGYITRKDLEEYRPVEREPVYGTYRGYKIVSMPPPSSGGIALIEMLNILENYQFSRSNWGSSQYIHKLVEAMKYAYADRTEYLGDPDFVSIPTDRLISKEYAKELFEQIKDTAKPAKDIKPFKGIYFRESNQTTHYSVYDSSGNAVSLTTTINSSFGSKIVVDGAGFLLNNEMDDFSAKPGSSNQYGLIGSVANSIEPEKRMLSSMTPTIVLKDNSPYLIIGSPGGSTIINTVLQVIMNCIDFNMNIEKAIDAPRIHNQWLPDRIDYEEFALPLDVKDNLIKMGYKIGEKRVLGMAEGIMIDNVNHYIYGASDRRGDGFAAGY